MNFIAFFAVFRFKYFFPQTFRQISLVRPFLTTVMCHWNLHQDSLFDLFMFLQVRLFYWTLQMRTVRILACVNRGVSVQGKVFNQEDSHIGSFPIGKIHMRCMKSFSADGSLRRFLSSHVTFYSTSFPPCCRRFLQRKRKRPWQPKLQLGHSFLLRVAKTLLQWQIINSLLWREPY